MILLSPTIDSLAKQVSLSGARSPTRHDITANQDWGDSTAEHIRHLHGTVARQAAVSGSVPILFLANASKT